MFTAIELPAIRLTEDEFLALDPIDTPQVGDRVALHSRGSYRVALVEKVTPSKVVCVYTTEGAISDAHKYQRSPENIRADIQRTREVYNPMPEHIEEYLGKLVQLADRVEARSPGKRWEEFVNETRKAVKFTDARKA